MRTIWRILTTFGRCPGPNRARDAGCPASHRSQDRHLGLGVLVIKRLTFWMLSVIVSFAALTVGLAGPASADESAPALSPAQGPAGTAVTASASDWAGCTSMSVSGWGITLGTASINSSGAFSLPFTVPASAPLGPAQLQFSPTCSHSTWMPFETFTVTTAPAVSWTSPVGNSGTSYVSSGSVTLAASATSPVGVARVTFTWWNAATQQLVTLATLTQPPWQTTISAGMLNNGWNQLNIQAWDTAGNASNAPYIWLYRDTSAPSVSWTSPVGNSGVYNVSSGPVTLAASASDNVGIARVTFTWYDSIANKVRTLATLTQPPWQTTINAGMLNGQWNQLNVQAWDKAGNASSSPYIWIYRSPPSSWRFTVPFATQMGSAGDPNSGSNNCGPASITMAVLYYGGSTTVPAAAVAIRGSNTTSNGPTDFKSSSSQVFLARFGLVERNITTWDQVRGEISAGRPVIILVNNNAYRYNTSPPYPNNNNGWFTTSHIVVVTGYDSNYVYINDPLRSSANYAVPVSMFMNAASTAPGTSPNNWYAASIWSQ